MPYTQTSIQEEMNIIDNRPFQHSSKKRHQVKARIDKIHPSLYLISLSLLTRAEWGKGLLTLSLLYLFRGTQRQFSENICSEDDLRSRIFRNISCKITCLSASPRIFEHLQNGIITHF